MKKIWNMLLALLCGAALAQMNLQLFADLNVQTSGSEGLEEDVKIHYHQTLINALEPVLIHDQFGQTIIIPAHNGKKVEVRYFDPLEKALTPLQEGVTPDGQDLAMHTITTELFQFGGYVTLSDVVSTIAKDPLVVVATQAIGSQAGRTLDTVTRDVITAGTQVMYAPSITDGVETEITLRSNLDKTCLLTPDLIARAQAILEGNLAETIDGSYVGIIHPHVKYDLTQNEKFEELHKYAAVKELFKGEIGMLGNTRFVVSTEAKIVGGTNHTGEGGKGDLAVYMTMILGKDAYATTKIESMNLEHIFKPLGSAGTADPLNQRATVGWKGMKGAVRLREKSMVRIESCSEFSGTAQAN